MRIATVSVRTGFAMTVDDCLVRIGFMMAVIGSKNACERRPSQALRRQVSQYPLSHFVTALPKGEPRMWKSLRIRNDRRGQVSAKEVTASKRKV